MRIASLGSSDVTTAGSSICFASNRVRRNAPGRWVSMSSGVPALPSPTIAAMRASVNSSFSG